MGKGCARAFDPDLDRKRNVIERYVGWLKGADPSPLGMKIDDSCRCYNLREFSILQKITRDCSALTPAGASSDP
jgi:hypothetical protein